MAGPRADRAEPDVCGRLLAEECAGDEYAGAVAVLAEFPVGELALVAAAAVDAAGEEAALFSEVCFAVGFSPAGLREPRG